MQNGAEVAQETTANPKRMSATHLKGERTCAKVREPPSSAREAASAEAQGKSGERLGLRERV